MPHGDDDHHDSTVEHKQAVSGQAYTPASSIASITLRGPDAPDPSSVTVAEFMSRLTDTDVTPGSCSTARHGTVQHDMAQRSPA
jgi:hypothetical protein